MKISKSDLLSIAHTEGLGFSTSRTFSASGVSTDTRQVKQGDLFVALRGETFDGHNFVTAAVKAGAAAIVVDQAWAEQNRPMLVSINVPRIVVADTVIALGQIASVWRRKFDIPVIAVAGSNGKTTTKEMLRSVLTKKYAVLCTEGNLNNHIGVPQTLFRLEKNHTVAVVEIGTNHPGELEYLCSILEPTHGVMTNIGREHLEFFRSLEGVAKAEFELFDWLSKNRGSVFVNADDKRIAARAKTMKKKVRYGISSRIVDVKGTITGMSETGCASLRIKPKSKSAITVSLSVPGVHNAINATAAATVGLAFKVPAAEIARALNEFSAANKRMQVVKAGGIVILNDTYNSNPDSVLAAFATLSAMKTPGRKIAVLGDMLELGEVSEQEHRRIGKAASDFGISQLMTFGPNSKLMCEASVVKIKSHFPDKQKLSELLFGSLKPGDAVLVKGSRGMKMEEVVSYLQQRLSTNA